MYLLIIIPRAFNDALDISIFSRQSDEKASNEASCAYVDIQGIYVVRSTDHLSSKSLHWNLKYELPLHIRNVTALQEEV